MAELAVVLTIRKLRQLASAEETTLIGAYDEMKKSVTSLEGLQHSIATDSDRVKKIEELVYRVEDVLQTYGVLARSKPFGMLLRLSSLSRRHGVAAQKQAMSKITGLCAKINQHAEMSLLPRVEQRSTDLHSESSNQQWRKNSVYGSPVGLEQEKEPIIRELLAERPVKKFLAISIWGRSGTGKATLAHEIYNDSRMIEKFNKHRVKIRVSDYIDVHDALVHVLQLMENSVDDNGVSVHKDLKESMKLIVLEDIRSINDWSELRSALGAEGCRILFTTQAKQVAESTTQGMYIHEKRPLTEENSWELLKKIVWPETGAEIDPAMERMGREMVKLCEGIPGAIIALAKQLAGKTVSEWEIVQKNARPYLSQVMAPSYAELSDDQKLCFRHLGHFREDPEIEPEKLCHLWAIEGLILPQDCKTNMTLLDLTQDHLTGLALKRTIDVRQIIEVKSCNLVGLMGDMCVSKAEETDFLKVMDLQFSNGDNQPSFSLSETRRLVIYLGKYDARVTPELVRNLRSLRIIKVHDERQQPEEFFWPSIMSKIKKFKALRILDFGRIDFQRRKVPEGTFALPFLRYLSFEGCSLNELPSSIGNLSYLEVLDLRVKDTCKIIIPDVLRRMGRLLHLYLPRSFQPRNGKKLRLDGLSELQTVKNFNSNLCEIRDLFRLSKLRDLNAKVEESLEDLKSITELMKTDEQKQQQSVHRDPFAESSHCEASSATNQKWLRSSIEVKNFDCYTETKHKAFRQLLTSGVPPILSFEGLVNPLPPHIHISQSFTEIVLRSTQLEEDPMATLENLAKLRLLVLDDDAFLGEKMVCSASGFPELKQLQLSRLNSFKEWIVENSAMPRLSHLKIENCEKLEMLPNESDFLDSLHQFKMKKMPTPFIEKVCERYDNLDHPPSLIRTFSRS